MLSFSYILSPTVKLELEKIELTRRDILLQIVSPRIERRLKFENLVKVIVSTLYLSGKSSSTREVVNILKGHKVSSPITNDVLAIRNTIDYMRENWLAEKEEVTSQDLAKILRIASPKDRMDNARMEQIVSFIHAGREHPIVSCALTFILILGELKDDKVGIKISSNVSILFAYDHGFDFRGLLNLPELFVSDLANLSEKTRTGLKSGNLSDFIEYYVQVFSIGAEQAYNRLAGANREHVKTLDLTQREQKILTLFEIPDAKVMNRDIQREFKVSQITASRDLASLATLGLILRRGKGRSVYYTKG